MEFPGVREHSESFTREDLLRGIEVLKKKVSSPKSSYTLTFENGINDRSTVFSQLFTVSLALATNFTPKVVSTFRSPFTSDPPVEVGKSSKSETFDMCKHYTPTRNYSFSSDVTPAEFLMNEDINKLSKEIGPAALHLLIHYALGVNRKFNLTQKQESQCKQVDKVEFNSYNIERMMEQEQITIPTGSTEGWLVSLFRGTSPMIYDHVSKSCFKARNYTTAGLSPVYPGIRRGKNDLVRSNKMCKSNQVVKEMIQYML